MGVRHTPPVPRRQPQEDGLAETQIIAAVCCSNVCNTLLPLPKEQVRY